MSFKPFVQVRSSAPADTGTCFEDAAPRDIPSVDEWLGKNGSAENRQEKELLDFLQRAEFQKAVHPGGPGLAASPRSFNVCLPIS